MEEINIKDILEDYKPNNGLFSEEDPEINKLKNVIFNNLDEVERRIILMYAEMGSLRKLGNELGICTSSAALKIKAIRNKIYAHLI